MGLGEQSVGSKLFGREGERDRVNWWKEHNAKLHNLLPSSTRLI